MLIRGNCFLTGNAKAPWLATGAFVAPVVSWFSRRVDHSRIRILNPPRTVVVQFLNVFIGIFVKHILDTVGVHKTS